MSVPIRIQCPNYLTTPAIADLRGMVSPTQHVVLHIARGEPGQKTFTIKRLAAAMPEFSVFDSGARATTECITICFVICAEAVRSHEYEIRAAMTDYIETCAQLLTLQQTDRLPPEWSTDDHGGDRCFTNSATGQVVEAPLEHLLTSENMDPYFFSRFVKSTPRHRPVADLISDDFHDALKMLRILVPRPELE